MESAGEYLRDMSEAMADGVVESNPTDIKRLAQIADDLDVLLGSPLLRSWGSKGRDAVERLRNGGN